jgi:hypothetical protein
MDLGNQRVQASPGFRALVEEGMVIPENTLLFAVPGLAGAVRG